MRDGLLQVDDGTLHMYNNLAQAYEGEFSRYTGKVPDQNGRFALDTMIGGSVVGYIAMQQGLPIGIAAVKTQGDGHEMCEFYIIPSRRKMNHGIEFAHRIFRAHAGVWQIKQISGADYATAFWRRVLHSYGVEYTEDSYQDDYWGRVTRQLFTSKGGPLEMESTASNG